MKAIKFIIPIILAVIVFMFLKLYGGELFANFNHPIRYEKYVDKYCNLYKVDKNLVYAIIKTESKFYPFAKSRTNSKRLMQISDPQSRNSQLPHYRRAFQRGCYRFRRWNTRPLGGRTRFFAFGRYGGIYDGLPPIRRRPPLGKRNGWTPIVVPNANGYPHQSL